MALLVIQDHEHNKHENHEHEHDNQQHYEGGGLLVVGRAKSKSRTIDKSRTKSSINSSSTSTTASCSSSSSSSRTILIPILVGCILMALGATFQSTQIIFNNNNSNSNNDGNNIGIRRKTTTTSTTKDNFKFIYPPPKYERNKYTFDSFIVGGGSGSGDGSEGIDLAKFGFEDEDNDDKDAVTVASSTTSASTTKTKTNYADFDYELFHDFDLSLKLTGNESWIDLLALRRDSISRSLSFYVDKVAYKRYLINQYSILQIDSIPSYLLKYKYELEFELEKLQHDNDSSSSSSSSISSSSLSLLSSLSNKIEQYLPKDQDYAAKPTHLSCSGGVWIIHNDIPNNITYVGNGKKKMVPHNTDTVTTDIDSTDSSKLSESKSIPSSITTIIANDIAQNLNKVQDKCGSTVLESHALRNVKPGVVVEERFTQPSSSSFSIDNKEDEVEVENNDNHENHNENDNENLLLKGGMEFKVFTIWGRAWLTVWRPGKLRIKTITNYSGNGNGVSW